MQYLISSHKSNNGQYVTKSPLSSIDDEKTHRRN